MTTSATNGNIVTLDTKPRRATKNRSIEDLVGDGVLATQDGGWYSVIKEDEIPNNIWSFVSGRGVDREGRPLIRIRSRRCG